MTKKIFLKNFYLTGSWFIIKLSYERTRKSMIKLNFFENSEYNQVSTTPKGQIRVKKFLEATEYMFIEYGYAGLTLRGIASKENTSLSAVQHYFKDKDILLKKFLAKSVKNYKKNIETSIYINFTEEPLERFINTIICIINELDQKNITSIFKEAFSISGKNKYIIDTALAIQKYNFDLIYKLILSIEPNISSYEYKDRVQTITMLLNGYIAQPNKFKTINNTKEIMINSILKLAHDP